MSIVSDKPQTTRHRVRGVFNRPGVQLVFVDTPGLHKPVTALGERVNATAIESVAEVDHELDVVCLVLDATKPFGRGDEWVARHLDMQRAVVVLNKIDRVKPSVVMEQLAAASVLDAAEYFAVSAMRGDGIDRLIDHPSAVSRRARRCSRSTPSAMSTTSNGLPSWCASSLGDHP